MFVCLCGRLNAQRAARKREQKFVNVGRMVTNSYSETKTVIRTVTERKERTVIMGLLLVSRSGCGGDVATAVGEDVVHWPCVAGAGAVPAGVEVVAAAVEEEEEEEAVADADAEAGAGAGAAVVGALDAVPTLGLRLC